jgi:hypothetical protein
MATKCAMDKVVDLGGLLFGFLAPLAAPPPSSFLARLSNMTALSHTTTLQQHNIRAGSPPKLDNESGKTGANKKWRASIAASTDRQCPCITEGTLLSAIECREI